MTMTLLRPEGIGGQRAVTGDGTLVGAGDVAEQTRQVMANVRTVLAAAGHVTRLGVPGGAGRGQRGRGRAASAVRLCGDAVGTGPAPAQLRVATPLVGP